MLPLLLALACGKDPADKAPADTTDSGDAEESAVDTHCPGDANCPDNDGALSVGAGKISITPDCFEAWVDDDGDFEWDYNDEAFLDCGCDRLCSDAADYPGPDTGEEDGTFQAVWMAGFHNSRPAREIFDDLWARAIVFDQGSTRIAIVSVDVIGFFNPEVEKAREALAAEGADVDLLIVASTHNHEGPDTMGIWGKTETVSGVDPDYNASVVGAVVDAVQQGIDGLREVGTASVGRVDMRDYHENGVHNVLTDLRDPIIIDETLATASFLDSAGQPIATLVHLGDHPESIADENTGITSDFAHSLRQTIESGVTWDAYSRDGVGGTAIFINGAVGGMMTSLRVQTEDPDGNIWDAYTYERTLVIGQVMGEMALDSVEQASPMSDPKIRFATRRVRFPVHNYGFQAMFLTGVLDRELLDYDSSAPMTDDNVPYIETEIDLVEVGDIRFLTVPGELLPELNIGGYDGSHVGSDSAVIIAADNPNPPDLSEAPEGPYIRDRVGGEHVWVIGLGNDEIGYIVPEYNFKLHDTQPWFEEPEGDHYEETNSLGPETAGLLDQEIDLMLEWTTENW